MEARTCSSTSAPSRRRATSRWTRVRAWSSTSRRARRACRRRTSARCRRYAAPGLRTGGRTSFLASPEYRLEEQDVKSRGSVLRGGRIGGAPGAEVDRGGAIEPRQAVPYWCSAGHESRPVFATTAEIPDSWPCDRCGRPAGRSEEAPPPPPPPLGASPKTPWEFLMMRRTVEEGEKLLEEALAKLRASRSGR